MTKKEMQETIKERCLTAWQDLSYCIKDYGKHDNKTAIARARWIALNNIYFDLFGREIKY